MGLWKRFIEWLTKLGNKHKAWKKLEPERHKEKLAKLKRQSNIQLQKEIIARSKFRIQKGKIKLMRERQESMPDFSGMGFQSDPKENDIAKELKKADKEAFKKWM